MNIQCWGAYEICKNGKQILEGKNLLTDDFLLGLVEALIKATAPGSVAQPWDTASAMKLQLGTDNDPPPAVGDTALNSMSVEMAATSISASRTSDTPKILRCTFNYSYTSAITASIVEMGMRLTRSGGGAPASYLMSRWLVDAIALIPGDVLTVNWTIYFARDFNA